MSFLSRFKIFKTFKTKPLIGLDLHSEEIRLVQLKPLNHTFCVEKVAASSLPVGVIVDGKIKDYTILCDTLKQLATDTQTVGSAAAIALSAANVITKRIKLAVGLTDAERMAAIAGNLDHYFPGMRDTLCFDFVTLDAHDTESQDILLVAARQTLFSEYVSVVQAAGWKVQVVDIDSHAAARALCFAQSEQSINTILDLSVQSMQLVVLQHQNILFSQSLVKTQDLAQQLKAAMQRCVSLHRHVVFHTLFLAGNNIVDMNIINSIQKQCEINIQIANPFLNMILSENIEHKKIASIAPAMLVSCGLALRNISW